MRLRHFAAVCAALLILSLTPCRYAEVYVNQTPPADWTERDLLRLTVFATGESDCMLLEAGGECMMIDGGANKWRDSLYSALTTRNITHLKYIYSTHPHDDHIDGLYRIMQKGITADEFVSIFPRQFRNELHKRTAAEAERNGISYMQLQNGDVLLLGDATLTIYHWGEGKTINDMSTITRLEYGECSMLLTADITGLAQRYFHKTLDPDFLMVDIAKFPHHGLTPFVTEFLDVVDPLFLFATNYDNDDIGKARSQAKYRKIPMMASGSGIIIMESDGEDWYIVQKRNES